MSNPLPFAHYNSDGSLIADPKATFDRPTLTDNQIQGLQALGVQAGSLISWRTVQDSLNAGACLIASDVNLEQPLLLGSRTQLNILPKVTITATGALQHNFARVGNAEYLDNGIPGVWIVAATERLTYGEGTITYNHSATTLSYAAPSDTAGTPVSIASVTNVATSNIFTLTSNNGIDQLHVVVIVSAGRTGTATKSLRVEPITGAKVISWVRNGSTFVATETAHNRKVGDIVMVFGTPKQHGYIVATTANTWTLIDTASASSGTAQAFGVRDLQINGFGAQILGSHAALPNTNVRNHDHACIIYAASAVRLNFGTIEDYTKYVIYATGCADIEVNSIQSLEGNCADIVHFTGPHRNARAFNVRAKAIDNIVGIGCCDYIDYNIFFPANGTVDFDDYTVRNIFAVDTIFEPVRVYNGNSGWLRRGIIDQVYGTYDGGSASCAVSIISDTNGSQVDAGNTQIDGLQINNITAVASSSAIHTPAVKFTGTGTKRGIYFDGIPARASGSNTNGTLVIDCPLQDVAVVPRDGAAGFSGAYFHVRGTGVIQQAVINLVERMRGDNQLGLITGTAQQPCIVQLESAAATIVKIVINNGLLDDISSTGVKATFVRNIGVVTTAFLNNIEIVDGDSVWKQLVNSNAATRLYINGAKIDATYGITFDVAMAEICATNIYQPSGSFAQVGAAGTYRWTLSNMVVTSRLIRNALGAGTHTITATNVNAGTFFQNDANNPLVNISAANCTATTPISIGGGTPDIRLIGSVSLPLDGAVINATATNHSVGVNFYNTNAAFGAGVGAYVRGSSAWVRVAA